MAGGERSQAPSLHQRAAAPRSMQAQEKRQRDGRTGHGAEGRLPGGPPLPPPLPYILIDAATPKLLVPSAEALYALLVLPYLIWGAAVVAGVLHTEPLPDGLTKHEFEHPLHWFDRHVFRVWGPALPFLPYLVRVLALAARWPPQQQQQQHRAALPPPLGPGGRPLRPAPTLAAPVLVVYGVVIVTRMLLYGAHVALQGGRRGGGYVLLSDHLLLAASVVACLQCELLCCLSDVVKTELLRGFDPGAAGVRQVAVAGGGLLGCVLLLVALYGDMYCTARWYHAPGESLAALAAGAALYQVPVAAWCYKRARLPPGRV